MTRRRKVIIVSFVVVSTIVIAVTGCTGGKANPPENPVAQAAATPAEASPAEAPPTAPPTAPPANVCGNAAVLNGPATMPKGAVMVPAGVNSDVNFSAANTTFWFAPGVHTLGPGEFVNINPAAGDTYLGAPGAILDGQHQNDSAFDNTAAHVTIEYLTIRNFGTLGGNQQQGVVNHDSGPYWTISHNTITGNAGAGVMLGSHDTLSWNCIENNQQYGFNAYSNAGEVRSLVLDHNEIAGNDTYNYEARQPGCGCSGGGKFWNVVGAKVTDNWILNNKSVGLWADSNNAGFEFAGNYFQNSQGVGLEYEISYNALIEYNTFVHNGVASGPQNNSFPTSAIYISESGSDSRVNTAYKTQFLIAHNDFVNNWSGIIIWENSNRFCGSPDNSSTGYCTMVNPKATLTTCATPATVAKQPYLSDCRWKAQNILVEDNSFTLDPASLGKGCTAKNDCGYNGVFSEYGSHPPWSPYQGDIVPTNITFHQNNQFRGNTYSGPWCFMAWELGTSVSFKQWQATAKPQSTAPTQFGQDAKSTHTGATSSCS